MGTARADACAVLLQDGRALIIGGIGSDGRALAAAEFFNTDYSYSSAPPLNTARASHSCSVLADGRVLAAGGTDGQGNAIASARGLRSGRERLDCDRESESGPLGSAGYRA